MRIEVGGFLVRIKTCNLPANLSRVDYPILNNHFLGYPYETFQAPLWHASLFSVSILFWYVRQEARGYGTTQAALCPDQTETVRVQTMQTMTQQKIVLLSPGQIKQICGVSGRTITKWIDQGWLKGFRIPGSRHRRVAKSDLLRFFSENRMPFTEDHVNRVL
jgi:excisionase family DNA binding protein